MIKETNKKQMRNKERKNITKNYLNTYIKNQKSIINSKGITLIALIITIIIMLILVTVTLEIAFSENGVLGQAKKGANGYKTEQLKESVGEILAERNVEKNIDEEVGNLKTDLEQIEGAEVEQVREDLCYVTRNGQTVTVYEDGDIVEGKVEVWDGATSEVPEIKDGVWNIYNASQFKFFGDYMNNNSSLTEEQKGMITAKGYEESDFNIEAETVINIMQDIDLGARQKNGELTAGESWTPITMGSNGIIEGNNHKIRGVYMHINGNFGGLFKKSANTIQNLTIKDGYISATGAGLGGITAMMQGGSIINCHNENTTVISESSYVSGGIVGQVSSNTNSKVTDCTNSGTISANGKDNDGFSYVGGIIGSLGVANQTNNCINLGNVIGEGDSVGGVMGKTCFDTNVTNCINKGTVIGKSQRIGGIIGEFFGNIENCYNSGEVIGSSSNVGGVVGVSFGKIINKCYNEGNVTANGEIEEGIGGILGQIGTNNESSVENCYNKGKVTAKNTLEKAGEGVGGIIGWISSTGTSGTVKNNYNIGIIEVENMINVGGVVGRYLTNTFTIENNYYIEGTTKSDNNKIGESKKSDEMKKQDFVDLLNAGQEEIVWEIQEGKNEGYPVIK